MKWQVRLLKNSLFALLPFPQTARKLKRRFLPYPAAIDPWTLEQGLQQVELLRSAGFDFRGKTILELGTGWQPIIPLLFRLAGVGEVLMVDAQRLLDVRLLRETAQNLTEKRRLIADRLGMSEGEVVRCLAIEPAADLEHMLVSFRLRYLAPADAGALGLPSGSIDAVTSRAVLEHIPPTVIARLFAEFARLLRPRGMMCHMIDNSDHWEHGDKSISRVNFLKFEDSVWRITLLNPLDYQNRLRHFEYLALLQQAGFRVVKDASVPDTDAMGALEHMRICSRYSDAPREQLAILTSNLVATL